LTGNGFGYSTSGGSYSSPYFASFLPTPGYLEVFSAPPIIPGYENLGLEDSELPISFSATIITVSEPTSILSLLALGTLGAPSVLKRHKLCKLTRNKVEKGS
ncbi:MAG: PEP-CTERM sorting domain-containing protein, partial [Nostoc sp.]